MTVYVSLHTDQLVLINSHHFWTRVTTLPDEDYRIPCAHVRCFFFFHRMHDVRNTLADWLLGSDLFFQLLIPMRF